MTKDQRCQPLGDQACYQLKGHAGRCDPGGCMAPIPPLAKGRKADIDVLERIAIALERIAGPPARPLPNEEELIERTQRALLGTPMPANRCPGYLGPPESPRMFQCDKVEGHAGDCAMISGVRWPERLPLQERFQMNPEHKGWSQACVIGRCSTCTYCAHGCHNRRAVKY